MIGTLTSMHNMSKAVRQLPGGAVYPPYRRLCSSLVLRIPLFTTFPSVHAHEQQFFHFFSKNEPAKECQSKRKWLKQHHGRKQDLCTPTISGHRGSFLFSEVLPLFHFLNTIHVMGSIFPSLRFYLQKFPSCRSCHHHEWSLWFTLHIHVRHVPCDT